MCFAALLCVFGHRWVVKCAEHESALWLGQSLEHSVLCTFEDLLGILLKQHLSKRAQRQFIGCVL